MPTCASKRLALYHCSTQSRPRVRLREVGQQAVPPATHVKAADQAPRLVALARPTPSRVSQQQEEDLNGTTKQLRCCPAANPHRTQNMNTTKNPSQRTEQERQLTAGTEHQSRDHKSSANAVYETPQGAEHRTFELTVASIYEMWLLTTFTGHAGEDVWVSSFLPFRPLEMKLTYRPGTLELPEVRWLVDRIFQFDLGSKTLRSGADNAPSEQTRLPRPAVLAALADQIHLYLDDYDVIALVKCLDISDRLRIDVATKSVPPVDQFAAFEAHVAACIQCVRLTYIDDSFLR